MSKSINIPDLGDAEDVEVIEILVKVGDDINADDPVIVLESAKASMDIPCPEGGKVEAIALSVGDKVNSGDAMLTLAQASAETAGNEDSAAKAEPPTDDTGGDAPTQTANDKNAKTDTANSVAQQSQAPHHNAPANSIHASPAVRRIATEHQIDLSSVVGSGPHGRITKADVQRLTGDEPDSAHTQATTMPTAAAAAVTSTASSQNPIPLSRIQQLSAQHLHRSWTQIPHVTHFDDADITALENWRQQLKQQQTTKLSLLPFVMKAVVHGLQQQPKFNCQLSDDGRQLNPNKGFHLGIAVNTDDGLVVPVIKNVDQKGVWQLAQELAHSAERARAKQLKSNDLTGGSFTISNLGGIGGQHFTPIINAPEVGILGLGQARWQLQREPNSGEVVDRLIQPLALSYDHRVIDGAVAAAFIATLKQSLEDIRQLLL